MTNEFAVKLKEVNIKASEVLKEINDEQDETIKQALITQFANEVFEKGVNFGLKK